MRNPLHPMLRLAPRWRVCIALALCAAAASWLPSAPELLRYERTLLAREPWRLLTAHLVHLNFAHLAMNLAALFLLCELLWRDVTARSGTALLAASALGTSGPLWALQPGVPWYAGVSGALHGLWAGFALHGAATPERAGRGWQVFALLLLAFKLAAEMHFGPSAFSARAIGAPVVAAAHLYGALAGLAVAAVVILHARRAGFRLK